MRNLTQTQTLRVNRALKLPGISISVWKSLWCELSIARGFREGQLTVQKRIIQFSILSVSSKVERKGR